MKSIFLIFATLSLFVFTSPALANPDVMTLVYSVSNANDINGCDEELATAKHILYRQVIELYIGQYRNPLQFFTLLEPYVKEKDKPDWPLEALTWYERMTQPRV